MALKMKQINIKEILEGSAEINQQPLVPNAKVSLTKKVEKKKPVSQTTQNVLKQNANMKDSNDKDIVLFDYKTYQSLNEPVRDLSARRPLEEDIYVTVKQIPELVTLIEEEREKALKKARKEGFDYKVIEAINNYYDTVPRTTVYFESTDGSDHITHLVIRKDANDKGRRYQLSELAVNETLYKALQLNQSTMNKLGDGKRQSDNVNYYLNWGKTSTNGKGAKVKEAAFEGPKTIRLNALKQVRAITSKLYKKIDHLEVIERLKEVIDLEDTTSYQVMLDERKMVMKFLYKNQLQKKYKGDVISAGLAIMNSEVGLSSLQTFMLLNVNGTDFMIDSKKSNKNYREVHKGYDNTESLENFGLAVQFATDQINAILERFKEMYSIKVPDAVKTVNILANRFQPTRSKKAVQHLSEQAQDLVDPTFRDIIQLFADFGFTKKHRHINHKHEMEMIAGKLINMDDKEIKEVL